MTAPRTPTRARPHWSRALIPLGACAAGLRWARRQPSYAVAWRECRVPVYLLWLVNTVSHEDHDAAADAWRHADEPSYFGPIHVSVRACHAIRAAVKRPGLGRARGAK